MVLLLLLLAIVQVGCATASSSTPVAPATSSPAPASPERDAPVKAPSIAEAPRPRPGAPSPLERGQALLAGGELASAAAALRQALRQDPDLVEARSSLALALYGMGDLDGAIEELRATLRRQPDASGARLTLAAALMAKQDWTGARAELDEALRRQPDQLQAHYTLGLVRYTLGDLAGAIESYRRVLGGDPEQHDARYNLALMLRLTHRDAEATAEFLGAAQAGLPRAQYFVGTAYAAGLGVERSLPAAIAWWSRAADQGVTQAEDALAQLRQVALGKGRRAGAERQAVEQAFVDFRAELWRAFPDVSRDGAETVGAALLRDGRVHEAVPVLIREASSLSEPAQRSLETLYEQGAGAELAAHDARILGYFTSAAAEGQVRPRIGLARIYARGLGVPQDVARAIGLLRGTPHPDAQRLLQELTSTTETPVRR